MIRLFRPLSRLALFSALLAGPTWIAGLIPGQSIGQIALADPDPTPAAQDTSASPPAASPDASATTAPAKLSLADKQEADRINRLWKQFWKEYAGRCILYNGKVTIFENYESKYLNSRGVTVADLINPPTGSDATPMGQQEAEAYAVVIPQMVPGEYGYIMSGTVVKVLGPQDAILKKIQFVDSDAVERAYDAEVEHIPAQTEIIQRETWAKTHKIPGFSETRKQLQQALDDRFKIRKDLISQQDRQTFTEIRIRGFDTSKMVEELRWRGPNDTGIQIAIVNTESATDSFGDQRRLIAIPADKIKANVTEEMFKKILSDRGLSIPKFVDLVLSERRKDSIGYKPKVMQAIRDAEMTDHPDAATN